MTQEDGKKDDTLHSTRSQEAWENNSDTPDVTIEINGSTSTLNGDDSSVTETEENKANMTIDEFLGETETVANDLTEEAVEMFNNLITRATGEEYFIHPFDFTSTSQDKAGMTLKVSVKATFLPHSSCRRT